MEKKLLDLDPENEFRLGISSVMTAFVLLRGEPGLDLIDTNFLSTETYTDSEGKNYKLPFSERYSAFQCLTLLWDFQSDAIPRERLQKSMHLMLDDPIISDLVVSQLTKWEDWSIQSRVIRMYDDKRYEMASTKRSIIRYMYACSRKAGRSSEEVKTAKQFLQKRKDENSVHYRNVMRILKPRQGK